jgi:hypothetical protein
MFVRLNSPICKDCVKDDEAAFQKLREHLNENPGQGIAVVSKETGVSMKKILKYIQEGRIEMTSGIAADNPLNCTRCGANITVGTLCEECRLHYNQAVMGLKEDSQRSRQVGTGMHSVANEEKKRR